MGGKTSVLRPTRKSYKTGYEYAKAMQEWIKFNKELNEVENE